MFSRFSQKIEFLIYKSYLIIFFDLKKSDPPSPSHLPLGKTKFQRVKMSTQLQRLQEPTNLGRRHPSHREALEAQRVFPSNRRTADYPDTSLPCPTVLSRPEESLRNYEYTQGS